MARNDSGRTSVASKTFIREFDAHPRLQLVNLETRTLTEQGRLMMNRLGCTILLAMLGTPAFAASALPVLPAKDQAALLKSRDPKLAANKKLAYDFFRIVLRARHLDEAEKYMKADYIQ